MISPEFPQEQPEYLVFNTAEKPDYREGYLAGDEAWVTGIQTEIIEGPEAAIPYYEAAIKGYTSAVWWRKDGDPELDYVFSLKLADAQTKVASHSESERDRSNALFDAADYSYRMAEVRLENSSETMEPQVVGSLHALIKSQRIDMNTARGYWPAARKELDEVEEEISSTSHESISDSLIRAQMVVQRAIIREAESRDAIKAQPKTPAGFLLEVVASTELEKV